MNVGICVGGPWDGKQLSCGSEAWNVEVRDNLAVWDGPNDGTTPNRTMQYGTYQFRNNPRTKRREWVWKGPDVDQNARLSRGQT